MKEKRKTPRRRRFALVLLLLGAGVVALGVLSVYSAPFATALWNRGSALVIPEEVGRLSLGRVEAGWPRTLSATDVVFEDPGGTELLRVDSVTARGRWMPLLRRRVLLDGVVLAGVSLRLVQRADGSWAIKDGPTGDTEAGAGLRWFVGPGGLAARRIAVRLDAHEEAVPERTRLMDARARVEELFWGDSLHVVIDSIVAQYHPAGAPEGHVVSLEARATWSDAGVNVERLQISSPRTNVQASGGLTRLGDGETLQLIDFEIRADPVDLSDVRLLLPTLRAQGSVTFETRFTGQLEELVLLLTASRR